MVQTALTWGFAVRDTLQKILDTVPQADIEEWLAAVGKPRPTKPERPIIPLPTPTDTPVSVRVSVEWVN